MRADEAPFVSLADFLRSRPLGVDEGTVALASETKPPADRRVPTERGLPTEPVATANLGAPPFQMLPVGAESDNHDGEPPGCGELPGGCGEAAGASGRLHVAALAIREAKLFRAALADAFEVLLPSLTRELALDVFGRELRLAAVDLETLARRMVAERLAHGPVRLRVAPADAQTVCELPVTVDPSLEPGDAVLECRCGDIDARLGVRLAAVLETVRG